MIKHIRNFFNITSAVVLGSIILLNCEPEADALGSQFFTGAEAVDDAYSIIAYNYNNNNAIRSDAAKLDSVVLGAFTEAQFGMQKANYFTQVRLSNYAPDFGTNPVLDSAVMVIKPAYQTASDSITTNTVEDYTFNDDTNTNVAAKKVVSTYKVKKYGKAKIAGTNTIFHIKVHEVNDFMGSTSDSIYSNKVFAVGTQIGSKQFNGNITSVKITKDSDGSELYNRDASIRIPLDSTFFQSKIITKKGSAQLADAASFIRYFRGIRISVDENDGYLFKFAPNSIELTLYYKNDQTTDNVTTRKKQEFTLNLGSSNVHYSNVQYERTQPFEDALLSPNTTSGDAKLYIQGMGGPGAGFKIPNDVVNSLKDKFKNDKIGIISAKIRIYTDSISWNNNYQKPLSFTVRKKKADATGKDLYTFLTDMSALSYSGLYTLVKPYDLSKTPAYYDIGITQSVKNVIEKEEDNDIFVINVGSYTYDSTGALIGSSYTNSQNYNTSSYTPNRAVFVGTPNDTDPLYKRRAKLLITYGKK